MFKIYKVIFFFIIVFFPLSVNSHVQHYGDLNHIEFDIYRNDKHIGKHIFSFEKSGDRISVKSEINFQIKKFGIVLYKYHAEGIEIYENGTLIEEISVPATSETLRYSNTHTYAPSKDSWYVVIVTGAEGSDLAPLFTNVERDAIQLQDVITTALGDSSAVPSSPDN